MPSFGSSFRVLTVREPWATLIAMRRKRYENRDEALALWAERNLLGRRLAIHAGLAYDRAAKAEAKAPDRQPWPSELHHGMIVAVVTVAKVVRPDQHLSSPYRARGKWALVFADVHRLAKPVEVEGGLGFRILANAKPPQSAIGRGEGPPPGSPYMDVVRQENARHTAQSFGEAIHAIADLARPSR